MRLDRIDIAIILAYLATSVLVGYWVSHRASRDMKAYFLGSNTMPWYVLGVSNASGMFDIAGTMWLVYLMFVYGLKSVWIPWLWPVFNQIFLMVYLSAWLRRSNVMSGAEWITTRFGSGKGARLSHLIVVVYALVSVIGFLTYAFKGIGKFATNFLPWQLSANQYALILMGITTFYVVKGGMFSVVVTEVIQFCILSVASIAIGLIAIARVSPEMLHRVVPAGWDNLFFGWTLNLRWSGLIDSVNSRIAQDGYSLFGIFFMMMLFKGILISMAGPAPNYDMQRVLSTKTPREASLMSAWVNVVLIFPRYFLITGLTILALVFYNDQIRAMGNDIDFEMVLPYALGRFVPVGLLGLVMAGLLAAFMSNFAATVNAAPPYIVNDIYKRFINPDASPRTYVRLSYLSSFAVVVAGISFGWFVGSINSVIQWIVSALWGGYTASNVLKWYWWRFNGYGYFWGMISGIGASLILPVALPHTSPLNAFPLLLAISVAGCLAGTLLTPPEDDEVLKSFYKRVRPWGFWGPVLRHIRKEDPSFRPNPDFRRDMLNIVVGVCWQTSLVALPVYVVIRSSRAALVSLAVVAVTSAILKFTWYDHLREGEPITEVAELREPAPSLTGHA
ncbi:MAG TPA: sodium:solute symporter family protein [Verrucomicrobiae bacterium]|nr:sodium:solute symporter family protein [Verrucomicrobiae bacterium]